MMKQMQKLQKQMAEKQIPAPAPVV